jgi:hypothetical protein
LRTKQRIREHDRMWYRICIELDWSYHPTVWFPVAVNI